MEISIDLLGQCNARRRGFDHDPATIARVGKSANQLGSHQAIDGERHAPCGAAEYLADRGGCAAMLRRAANDAEHQVVGHADAVRTGDLSEYPIDRDIQAYDMPEQTIRRGLVKRS